MKTPVWRAVIPVLVALIIAILPVPEGLTPKAWYYFALFAAVIVGLILEPIPAAAIGGSASLGRRAPPGPPPPSKPAKPSPRTRRGRHGQRPESGILPKGPAPRTTRGKLPPLPEAGRGGPQRAHPGGGDQVGVERFLGRDGVAHLRRLHVRDGVRENRAGAAPRPSAW